jgi:hypothetical protein
MVFSSPLNDWASKWEMIVFNGFVSVYLPHIGGIGELRVKLKVFKNGL